MIALVGSLLQLGDYNTRVVLLGTGLLGCAAGLVGSFMLLRKRALMGDALSHATLPGIALAFLAATWWGYDGKSLPLLLAGATVTGLAGVGTVLVLRSQTRLKEDTAMGAVLSVFFGAGLALLSIAQQTPQGNAAGLEAFIYGKTASMVRSDTQLIGIVALLSVVALVALHKEWKLLCFDEGYAGTQGYPVGLLDWGLMGLVVAVTIVGLQAVGLVLMIALLVIPPAAARFWTERMGHMSLFSAVIGGLGCVVGALASAQAPALPSGAMIVLACSLLFALSLVLGTQRGLLMRWWRRTQLDATVHRQHLLRAMFELGESLTGPPHEAYVPASKLFPLRSWSPGRLARSIASAARAGLVERRGNALRLSATGLAEATRLTRQHRLWELYLMHYADVAASQVDRDADALEHVLEPDVVARLERLLQGPTPVPASPHPLLPTAAKPPGAGGTTP